VEYWEKQRKAAKDLFLDLTNTPVLGHSNTPAGKG
jgi:hypothetical protein